MILLVRTEIQDFFNEASIPLIEFLPKLLETGSITDYSYVNFSFENTSVFDIDPDDKLLDYLKCKQIDPDDILVVSTILTDGFLKTIKGYYSALEDKLTGGQDGK